MRRINGKITLTAALALVLTAGLLLCACDDNEPVVSNGPIVIDKESIIAVQNELGTDPAGNAQIEISAEADDNGEPGEVPEDEEESITGSEEGTEGSADGESDGKDTEPEDASAEESEKQESENDQKVEGSEAPGPVVPGAVEEVGLNDGWTYADYSAINSGSAKLYRAADNRKGVVIGVNAGHGTKGGQSVKTYCHPDMSPKVTSGSTASGSVKAAAVSGGMSFADGASEASVALREAQILRDILLSKGYDVLMLRDDSDVQLDNIARTVISNNTANCMISLHWDGDNLSYDKGCFYISTPDGIKNMDPVSTHWQQHEALGQALIAGLADNGCKIYKGGSMNIDLTQTSYSTIPSVDIELGNAASAHDDATLTTLANGLANGISRMY